MVHSAGFYRVRQMLTHGDMEQELGTQRNCLLINSFHIYWVLTLCQTEESLLSGNVAWNKRSILVNCWQYWISPNSVGQCLRRASLLGLVTSLLQTCSFQEYICLSSEPWFLGSFWLPWLIFITIYIGSGNY